MKLEIEQKEFLEACEKSSFEDLQKLIKDVKFNLSFYDEDGHTPFYIACKRGDEEIVKLLLKSGIEIEDVRAIEDIIEKRTVKKDDINVKENIISIINSYLKKEDQKIELMIACEEGYVSDVKDILKDNDFDPNFFDEDGCTPFYIACEAGYLEIVEIFLKDKRIDQNKPDDSGRTPFLIACKKGHKEIVELLLDNRIGVEDAREIVKDTNKNKAKTSIKDDFNVIDKNIISVINSYLKEEKIEFIKACEAGRIEEVKKILQSPSFNPNFFNQNNGRTPFYIACKEGNVEIVKILLDDIRVDRNQPDNNHQTPFFAACFSSNEEIVKILQDKNKAINVNSADNYGWTPLHVSCFLLEKNIVKLLISDPRTNLDAKTTRTRSPNKGIIVRDGYTAVDIAIEANFAGLKNDDRALNIANMISEEQNKRLNFADKRLSVALLKEKFEGSVRNEGVENTIKLKDSDIDKCYSPAQQSFDPSSTTKRVKSLRNNYEKAEGNPSASTSRGKAKSLGNFDFNQK